MDVVAVFIIYGGGRVPVPLCMLKVSFGVHLFKP
jgi:hypothetical protein